MRWLRKKVEKEEKSELRPGDAIYYSTFTTVYEATYRGRSTEGKDIIEIDETGQLFNVYPDGVTPRPTQNHN